MLKSRPGFKQDTTQTAKPIMDFEIKSKDNKLVNTVFAKPKNA